MNLAVALKGDKPGHEFHGNQFTSGSGGGVDKVLPGFEKTGEAGGTSTYKGPLMSGQNLTRMVRHLSSSGYQFQHVGTGMDFSHDNGSTVQLRSFQGDAFEKDPYQIVTVKTKAKKMDFTGMLKRDFSQARRNHLAHSGKAMPDGSFPIVSAGDVQNAVHLYGKASDPAAAKAHIIDRARALGAVGSLPPEWGVKKDEEPVTIVDRMNARWNQLKQFADRVNPPARKLDYTKALDARDYFQPPMPHVTGEVPSATLTDMVQAAMAAIPADERERFRAQMEPYTNYDDVPDHLRTILDTFGDSVPKPTPVKIV